MKRVEKKLDNSNLIDKITLHIFGAYARATALRAAQNALAGLSLPTSVLDQGCINCGLR